MRFPDDCGRHPSSVARRHSAFRIAEAATGHAARRTCARRLATAVALALAPSAFADAFPARMQLADLLAANGGDGTLGFVLEGGAQGEAAGWSVNGVGDVNADGIDDVIVASYRMNETGGAYVVFGRDTAQSGPFPAAFDLASLLPENGGDGTAGFAIIGALRGDVAGYAVAGAGDVNGDGIDDILVGAPLAADRWGHAYVVFGRNTQLVGNFPARFELASLYASGGGDGTEGFVLAGIAYGASTGDAVSAAGDVNGDGIDDLIVGARHVSSGPLGEEGDSYVVFGRDTALVGNFPPELPLATLLPDEGGDGSAGFVLRGFGANDALGTEVDGAGDLNGDGLDDIVVSAPYRDVGYTLNAGQVYVVFGRDTAQSGSFPALLPVQTLLPGFGGDGSIGFVLAGMRENDRLAAVSGAGDLNSDGIDDLIVGSGGTDFPALAGQAYVLYGRDTAQSGNFAPMMSLARLLPGGGGDGTAGFVVNGAQADERIGHAVSGASDVNGDGIDDVIIAASNATIGMRDRAGRVYVLYGRGTSQAPFPAVFSTASLFPGAGGDGSTGIVMDGVGHEDFTGFSVDSAGDVNGDGIPDLLIGAHGANLNGETNRGRTYVVFGRAP